MFKTSNKKFQFVISALFLSVLNSHVANSDFGSHIFCYDDLPQAKGLHLNIKNQNWHGIDIRQSHTDFYCNLFGDSTIMKQYGGGSTINSENTKKRVNINIDRYAQGHPHGFITGVDNEFQPFMFIIAGGGDRPGTSELAYIVDKDHQNKKFCKNATQAIIDIWAPEVRRIGRGEGFDNIKYANVMKNFGCFGHQVLDQLDATASPSNVASWKNLTTFNFEAAHQNLTTHRITADINFDGVEFNGKNPYALMENELLKLFINQPTGEQLIPGQRYSMIDGNARTFSKHDHYDRIKYHFSKKVE